MAASDRRIVSPQALVISALVLVLVALALLNAARLPGDMMSLTGAWQATVLEPGHPPATRTVDLPGRFNVQGIAPEARVRATRTLVLPPHTAPWGLHLETPLYHATVRWDGEELGRIGVAEGTDPASGIAPLLAIIPPDPDGQAHTLELDLRGDHHQGGLTGRIRLGPLEQLLPGLQQDLGSRLGFALAFLVIGVLHMLGAAGDPNRRGELFFGLATLSIAMYAYQHASQSFGASLAPYPSHLIRRFLVAGMITFPIWFAATFVFGGLQRSHRMWGGLTATTALVSLGGPWVSVRMENVQDVLTLVSTLWMTWMAYQAWRRGVSGSAFFIGAVLVGMFGALTEVAVTNGLMPGIRWLYPSLAVFLLFGSLAVVAQDRTLSARHRRLVRGNADAMVELTTSGVVLELNPTARAFVPGLSVGSRLQDVLPEALRPLLVAHLQTAKHRANRLELRLLDGRVVESVATVLDPDTLLLVLRDVTRRRRAEDDLVQAARLETAGMLAGGVAHDFNNLLGTLLGHVGLLRIQTDAKPIQDRLDRMENTIERASLVTRRLLAVGGRSESAPGDVDVEEVLDEAVEIAEPALPAGISLDVAVDGPLPRVHVSDEDLRHVVLNLILNARDAMEGSGQIRLTAEQDDGGGVRICVEDDGPGVPKDLRDKIFEPFFTTKGTDKGTGLGLPMAQRLLRRHGGRIELSDADADRGALFVIRLRRAAATPVPIRHAIGAYIAVVDDEPALCAAYAAALEEAGYRVRTFPDGSSALGQLAVEPPHVLVTDVVMPGMSGLELAAGLRELYPSLPVLVVSGYVPTSERTLDRPTEHLDKPVRPSRIVEAIGRLLGSIDDVEPRRIGRGG